MCKCQGRTLTYCMTSIQKGNIWRDRLEQLTGTLPKKKIIWTAFFFFEICVKMGVPSRAWQEIVSSPFIPNLFYFYFFFLLKVKKKKKTICKTSFLISLAAGQTMEDLHYQSCWVSWIPNSWLESLWNHSSPKWQIHFPKSIKQLSRRFNCPNLSSLDFVNPRHQSQLRSQRDLELLHTAVLEMTSTSCLQVSHGCKDPQVLRGKVLVRLAPLFFFFQLSLLLHPLIVWCFFYFGLQPFFFFFSSNHDFIITSLVTWTTQFVKKI